MDRLDAFAVAYKNVMLKVVVYHQNKSTAFAFPATVIYASHNHQRQAHKSLTEHSSCL